MKKVACVNRFPTQSLSLLLLAAVRRSEHKQVPPLFTHRRLDSFTKSVLLFAYAAIIYSSPALPYTLRPSFPTTGVFMDGFVAKFKSDALTDTITSQKRCLICKNCGSRKLQRQKNFSPTLTVSFLIIFTEYNLFRISERLLWRPPLITAKNPPLSPAFPPCRLPLFSGNSPF